VVASAAVCFSVALSLLFLVPSTARAVETLDVTIVGPDWRNVFSGPFDYTVTVSYPSTTTSFGNVKLTDILVDKTGHSLTPSPANITPLQGSTIDAAAVNGGSSCTIDTVDTVGDPNGPGVPPDPPYQTDPVGPNDPNGPNDPPGSIGVGSVIPTGHHLQRATCDLGTLAASGSKTVTITVTGRLNSFGYDQPTGVIANTATAVATATPGGIDVTATGTGLPKQSQLVRSSIEISDAEVTEGTVEGMGGTIPVVPANFFVTLVGASPYVVTVNWDALDGTASAPSDYTDGSGTLVFAPGETTKVVTILVNDDAATEGTETFSVNLTNVAAPTALAPAQPPPVADSQGVGTILDND
jgi:hypothetical protein